MDYSNKSKKLGEIYETFTDQIVTSGWKGEFFGWTENVRCEVPQGGRATFKLDNGFSLEFKEFSEDEGEEPRLVYWFEGKEDSAVQVEELEQLLELVE